MKKHFIVTLVSVLCFSFVLTAQNDADPNVIMNEKPMKRMFKPKNPVEDKTDLFDVSGLGGTVFTASNKSDGTTNSYNHTQKITLSLILANSKSQNFQLVFYSREEETPYAAEETGGIVSVYFPISMYDEIKQKLDQSITARKKVQVKVIQKKDGYREGTLIL